MIEKFQSNFVFGLQGNQYQEFIDRVAKPIIQQIVGTDDYEIIPPNYHLSFKDFDKKSRVNSIFPEFYYHFLGDIVKKNNQVSFKTKVCISFDERLCNDICPYTNRKIATIKIADVKLVYFIFFDVKEFFDFIYLGDSIFSQVVNVKIAETQIQSQELIKFGYIHNINFDRKFSFIRTSMEDGIPLHHDEYGILLDLNVGDFVKLTYTPENNRYPIKLTFSSNQTEIPNVAKRFRGTLTYPHNKNCAFINTIDKTSIYVRVKLANEYQEYDGQIVDCVASLDKMNRWQAELILV